MPPCFLLEKNKKILKKNLTYTPVYDIIYIGQGVRSLNNKEYVKVEERSKKLEKVAKNNKASERSR